MKLDIFEVLKQADKKNFDWYSNLSLEEQKAFTGLVSMKWFSLVEANPELAEYQIEMVNEVLNKNFWNISAIDNDLVWRLMCAIGVGKPIKHGWIPLATQKKAKSIVDELFLQYYPQLNKSELSLLKSKYDKKTFVEFLDTVGIQESERKKYIDTFKKESKV